MFKTKYAVLSIGLAIFVALFGCEKDNNGNNNGNGSGDPDDSLFSADGCEVAMLFLDSMQTMPENSCEQIWGFQASWYNEKCLCDQGYPSEVQAEASVETMNSLRDLILTMYGTGGEGPYGFCGPVPPLMQSCPVIEVEGEDCGTGATEIVEVYNPATGRTWMDRNLGASRAATNAADAEAYGGLFQWGRGADGHQCRDSEVTSDVGNSPYPGHDKFIIADYVTSYNNWYTPSVDGLWQGESGTNNPCPDGYRIPTIEEWEAELASWSQNSPAGAMGSPLKLPMGGYRASYTGMIAQEGTNGRYWSSTLMDVDGVEKRGSILTFGTNSNGSHYASIQQGVSGNTQAAGLSVRCIKD